MQKEIWKTITGYEGLYEISNLGRVKSLPKHRPGQTNKEIIKTGRKSQDEKQSQHIA